jgi:transglutaminase-like putative cysteine protease
LTLASTAGLWRLYSGRGFVAPVLFAVVASHLTAWALRRRQVNGLLAGVISVAAIVLFTTWLVLPQYTSYGLPTATTWKAAHDVLNQALTDFRAVLPPAPVTTGFELVTVLGVSAIAFLADWAAFRMRTIFEACIPSFTLFVFAAVLANRRPEGRGLAIALEVVGLEVFLLVQHASIQAQTTAWFASRRRGAIDAVTSAGVVLGTVAVIAALALGPLLPGATSHALFSLHGDTGGGSSSRTTVSPLVDIRTRLVDQSDTEVFTVRPTAPSYWRLTSLDTFDGNIWSSNDSYAPAHSALPHGQGPPSSATITAQFTISRLASIWLPAAYEPVRIDGVDNVSYNDTSGSLISKSDTSDGLTYSVESVVPTYSLTASALRNAPSSHQLGDTDLQHFLALPANVPSDVIAQARLVTAGAPTEYDKARLLQDWFHQNFTYSLNVQPGHGSTALEDFLFHTRTGYCEQFAGSYAVMARAIGLPTRVAVGFTPGDPTPDGIYHVKDLHAHAWPEVFFPNFGWIAFEPTPGREIPGANGYTGQTSAGISNVPPTTPTTQQTSNPSNPAGQTKFPRDESSGSIKPIKRASGTPAWARFLELLAWPVGAFVLYAAAVLGAKAGRRRWRWRTHEPAGRVLAAWATAGDALARVGLRRQPAETFEEFSTRVRAHLAFDPPVSTALAGLGTDAATACYAGDGRVAEELVPRTAWAAAQVEEWVNRRATPWQRVLDALDPRPLLAGLSGANRDRFA